MSRTDKDRPYWVIMNDRTLGRIERHDHRFQRDGHWIGGKRENYRLEPYGDLVWIQRYSNETPGMTPEEHTDYRRRGNWSALRYTLVIHEGHLKWYYEQRQRETYDVVKEPKWIPEATECTIDRPYSDWRRYRYVADNCCDVVVPDRHVWGAYEGPVTQERVLDERRRRRAASTALKGMVGEYNTYGDVDDSQWLEMAPRNSPFGGGYWD